MGSFCYGHAGWKEGGVVYHEKPQERNRVWWDKYRSSPLETVSTITKQIESKKWNFTAFGWFLFQASYLIYLLFMYNHHRSSDLHQLYQWYYARLTTITFEQRAHIGCCVFAMRFTSWTTHTTHKKSWLSELMNFNQPPFGLHCHLRCIYLPIKVMKSIETSVVHLDCLMFTSGCVMKCTVRPVRYKIWTSHEKTIFVIKLVFIFGALY